MLVNLHVKNLALIEEENIDFDEGLNILSGETGAGKSIILGSINAALGSKTSPDFIRSGCEYGLSEITFAIPEDKIERIKELGVISCDDGELMCEILDDVDFDKIKKSKPVWFLGYSDNTNLTFLLPTICDITAIYSPCAPAYGMEPWHPSLKDTFELLTGKSNMAHGYDKWEKESLKNEENPLVPYNVTEKTEIKKFGAGKDDAKTEISGRLIGGCLDCLSNLAGTKFDKVSDFNEKYKEDGIIWFMESCDLNPMAIRRAIWQLDHAGWFKYVKGFLIGRPLCLDEEILGVDRYNAVYPLLEKYNVPIIMDLDIGHTAPMMPIVSGAKAEIVVEKNSIKIHYKELEV